ncbi:calcium/sodium antiporter [Methanogenium organophilum]|uniref:Calcium/sodium antiporter n=1 Tax=Methanogenium organophilum TaxID=2199 RepID=A0A9X9S4P7_METOG|nr:calcium/sodium antiporter [Methanogenium organophilum]WAI01909.1 calcium/sodium antiporter [Methanogenium organophilum]
MIAAAILLFLFGMGLLIKGADYFVEGGGGLAARYGVSSATIGFTVIAFGTSLPEFVVSVNAVISGNSGVALGNALGSNIANIALVLALCALISPAMFMTGPSGKGRVQNETILMIAATVFFALLALTGELTQISGVLMLAGFGVILYIIWKKLGTEPVEKIEVHGRMDWALTAGGLVAVIIGSQLVLDSAITIAEAFGIPEFVIGMTIVAFGTSLPELATSLMAILRGDLGISAGNLMGSNIFNLLLVLGTGAIIRPIPIPSYTDVLVVLVFSLAVIPIVKGKPKVIRAWAAILVVAYFTYVISLYIGF